MEHANSFDTYPWKFHIVNPPPPPPPMLLCGTYRIDQTARARCVGVIKCNPYLLRWQKVDFTFPTYHPLQVLNCSELMRLTAFLQYPETVSQRCSVKKVFLQNLQNL